VLAALFPALEASPLDGDALADDIRGLIDEAELENEGARIHYRYGTLLAVQKRKVLNVIGKRVAYLQQCMAPRFEYRYLLYEVKAGTGEQRPSHLDPGEAEALYKRVVSGDHGKVLFTGEARGRTGDYIHFGKRRTPGLLLDLDVEIAQKSSIMDPVVARLPLGHDLNVLPLLGPDGKDLALFCLFTRREISSPPEKLDLIVNGFKIERVRVEQIQTAFSARIAGEGGIVVKPGGTRRPGLRALLVVRRLDSVPESVAGQAVIPIGLFGIPVLKGTDEGVAGVRMGLCNEPDELFELVHNAAGKGQGDEKPLVGFANNMFMVLSGSSGQLATARNLVRYFTRDLERNFVVEIHREAKPLNNPATVWQALGGPIGIPCLGGRLGFALNGVEENYVGEYDVEVAQESKSSDPITKFCFDGLQAVVGVEAEAGACRVRLSLVDRSILGFRQIGPGSDFGLFEVPDEQEVTWRQDFLLESGATRLLGEGPVRDVAGLGPCRTRVSIRLVEVKQ